MSLKVEVDEDKCIAAGQCVFAAPEVFDQRDEDGVVVVLEEHPSADHEQSARSAAALCPAAAIELREQ
ncbi:ferredoxin [Brachybacterium sacelli]|uniref:Ferredoxin n=1 Tax=Brachybacterium sacelli TaxID=173364 RepID=A0ABS4WXZ9_9MICO|nr:ferredoxin [Brachybacterium sacelli]MBP2381079.1 ferredoxin [Brachybacterium sacelli]